MFCATSSRRLVCVWFKGTALNEGSRVCITQAATPLWFVALTDPQPRSGTPLPTRQPIACSAALAALSQIGSTIAPCTQPLRGVIRRRCVRFVCIPVSSSWLNWKPDTPPSSLHAMFCSCSIAIAELRFASECRQNVVSPRSIGLIMNSLLMQLALAALGQFGGNGPMPMGGLPIGAFPAGRRRPVMPVSRPMTRYPTATAPGRTSSLQLASLATATCLMRERQLSRAQAVDLLDRQGQIWGWEPRWGQRIQLASVDGAINAAGGCRTMVRRIQNSPVSTPSMATVPVNRNPVRTDSRSEREGFGLFPYR